MFTLNCKGRLLQIDRPIVMGIINITPDSFYSGSRQLSVDAALQQAEKMLSDGATILDIGGQSTRPGAVRVSPEEELLRILPVIEAIHGRFPDAFISVDSFYSAVAKDAVASGASIINDISGGFFDPGMLDMVATLRVPYVCMHSKGNFETMHKDPSYDNVSQEVLDYFIQRISGCNRAGITDIIIDPGFGFAKNSLHNFALLKNLELFSMLKKPLLLGISRKSTVYKTLNIPIEESLNGTTVLHTAGLLKGANILRVHDVREAVEAITLVSHLM